MQVLPHVYTTVGAQIHVAVSSWRFIVAIDVYTRNRFSEFLGSRLGGPGQKALQAMNEFTLFVDFCLIPLSKTCAFDVPAKNL